MAQVELRDVVKRYGDFMAVDHVSLTVGDGEFVALVGPSGCGKTTSLNLVAGLLDTSDGDILIDDRRVNDLDPKDRDIAMVFQNYALYPNKSVAQNLAFPLRQRRIARGEIDAKVNEAARLLDITHLLDRRPRELSGGQQQRVALGRALVRDPHVFLMDEPLSNLDAKLRVQMRAELKLFHQELDATVVYVTHDQLEAMTMADRIAVMSGGVLQQYDTPEKVFEEPNNVFVAGFVGSPQMNLIEARIAHEGGATVARGLGWHLALEPGAAARAALSQGPDVVLGARHSGLTLHTDARADAIAGRVYTLEPTGDLTFAHVRLGDGTAGAGGIDGAPIVASVEPQVRLAVDQPVWLGVDQDRLHLFDAATQQRLVLS